MIPPLCTYMYNAHLSVKKFCDIIKMKKGSIYFCFIEAVHECKCNVRVVLYRMNEIKLCLQASIVFLGKSHFIFVLTENKI